MAAGGKALCCIACQDGQSIASGSSNGSVHVWRVEYVTCSGGMPDKYTGLQCTPTCQVALPPCLVSCYCPLELTHNAVTLSFKDTSNESTIRITVMIKLYLNSNKSRLSGTDDELDLCRTSLVSAHQLHTHGQTQTGGGAGLQV